MSPGGFEDYVSSLFEWLGYERVTLRGKSGDQGADILAEKNGERVAIQCKQCKGIVGSQEVRDLLGAMQLTQAQKGVLITTSMFSIPVVKAAEEAPIDMIDGNKLIELIAQAEAK